MVCGVEEGEGGNHDVLCLCVGRACASRQENVLSGLKIKDLPTGELQPQVLPGKHVKKRGDLVLELCSILSYVSCIKRQSCRTGNGFIVCLPNYGVVIVNFSFRFFFFF